MRCTHRQCVICLQRECHQRKKFQQVGQHAICAFCLVKAVTWALRMAQGWGGAYDSDKPCGMQKEVSNAGAR